MVAYFLVFFPRKRLFGLFDARYLSLLPAEQYSLDFKVIRVFGHALLPSLELFTRMNLCEFRLGYYERCHL